MNVVLMSGISGAGKDTYIKERFVQRPIDVNLVAQVCSADDYFMRNGVYTFAPHLLPNAHAKCLRDFTEVVTTPFSWRDTLPYNLVVNNTNLTTEELAPYVALAAAYGFPVELVTVCCEPHIAAARSHHVNSLPIVRAMHDRLQARKLPSFWKIKETIVR
jgi:hypothetical protein